MEITNKKYGDARHIVKLYEKVLSQNESIELEKFKAGIIERDNIMTELKELIDELDYCVNPIGELTSLYQLIPKASLQSIIQIETMLDKLKDNFYETFE